MGRDGGYIKPCVDLIAIPAWYTNGFCAGDIHSFSIKRQRGIIVLDTRLCWRQFVQRLCTIVDAGLDQFKKRGKIRVKWHRIYLDYGGD
jgi:hypothetical protein